LKILQLIQKPQLRGAEVFASQLSTQLSAIGHDVHLVSLLSGQQELPFSGKRVQLNRSLSQRFIDVKGWKALAQYIKDFNPDVVQANAGDTLKYAVLSKLFFRLNAPIIFRNASVISRYIKSPWVKRWNARLFRHVDFVVSVTEESRRDFLKLFPFMQDRIQVIPIGIDLNPLPSDPIKSEPYIIHIGGFTFEKNHTRLLHIFKMINEKHPQLSLWLVGDGPLRKQVEQQCSEMGLKSVVRFLGFQREVMPLIQSAKMLLLPSIIEGLPGVLLESMYCKTPVVAYDVGGISEIVKKGKTGWLVDKDDEDGFVKAVEEVLFCSPEELKRITNQAYQQVIEQYDNKVIAKRFEEVYGQLAMINEQYTIKM
jgi:glycosyltransferase involved in cell wall biosynthesis